MDLEKKVLGFLVKYQQPSIEDVKRFALNNNITYNKLRKILYAFGAIYAKTLLSLTVHPDKLNRKVTKASKINYQSIMMIIMDLIKDDKLNMTLIDKYIKSHNIDKDTFDKAVFRLAALFANMKNQKLDDLYG